MISLLSRLLACAGMYVLLLSPASAQDAATGAALYMRLPNDMRSCVTCHGPDPGLSHNNILRAADNPDGILKALGSAAPMQYLGSQLSAQDRADIAAFLGTVARLRTEPGVLRVWPVTMEFGSVSPSLLSAAQRVRVRNPSTLGAMAVANISSTSSAIGLTHDCPAMLQPSASCEISVRVRPDATGLVRGAVRVDVAGQIQYAGVSGYGAIAPVSALEWRNAPDVVAFDAAVNGAKVQKTIALFNPGPMPAVLGLASITGPNAALFKVESGCAQGSVLVAGTECELAVSFSPGSLASSEAVLQMRGDQGNPAALRLVATAATAPVIDPVVTLPPAPELPGSSGGGCSIKSADAGKPDPTLIALVAAAVVFLSRRTARPKRRA